MRSLVLSLVSLVALNFSNLRGQNSTTFQKIATNIGQNNYLYGPVYSIGQATHQFTVVWYDNGVNTCYNNRNANPGGLYQDPTLEVIGKYESSSNNAFISIPFQVASVVGGASSNYRFARTISASSLAPFIYLQFQNNNWTNCRADIYYGGSTTNVVPVIPVIDGGFSISNSSIYYEGALRQYLTTVTSAGLTAIANQTVTTGGGTGAGKICLYQMTVQNATVAAVTYTIRELLSDGVTYNSLFVITLPANTSQTFGDGTRAFMCSQVGSASISGVSTTATVSNITLLVRNE